LKTIKQVKTKYFFLFGWTFLSGKYNFLGLANSPDKDGIVWNETNEVGFFIFLPKIEKWRKDNKNDLKELDQAYNEVS